MNINNYKRLLTIRLVEDRFQELCFQGEAGDLHFSKGQEAISVGVCNALSPKDHIITHHRTISHQIARGAELYPLIAEVLGKATGTNGGRAGEMHINDPKIRHDFSFQLVGTCVPVATGLAWAMKYHKKNDEIVAVFFGDAASSNGQIHEGLTIAGIHKVPLLLVCENNSLAGNIRPEHYLPTSCVSDRMAAYNIQSELIDGNDLLAVQTSAEAAINKIRHGGGPFLLECNTTRLCWHKQGQRDVRPKEELEELSKRDPLLVEEKRLGISSLERASLEEEIRQMINPIFEKAINDPIPELS